MTNFSSVPSTKTPLPTRGISGSYDIWLEQKQSMDSKIWSYDPNYWYIQGKVYDLTQFLHKHPGGPHWIKYTQGHNITEHYIVHHLNLEKTNPILDKYEVKNKTKTTKIPQQRYTFDQNGLFSQVKKRLLLKYTPQQLQDSSKTKLIGITIFLIFFISLVLTGHYQSYLLALLSGYLIFPLTGIAHNFVHMKNSPFKYFYLVTGFTPKQWEIMHCLSHHQYTNTLLDYELQAFEPLIYFLRIMPQNTLFKLILIEIVYFVTIPFNIVLKLLVVPLTKRTKPQWEYLVPLTQILLFYLLNHNFIESLKLFLLMQCFFGDLFTKVTFGGHRIQTLWTQGETQIKDYGQHAVYTCNNVHPELKGGFLSFFIMSGFNVHTVHHMFPTIDNQHLWKADQILEQVCKERGIQQSRTTLFQAIKSVYKNYLLRKPWNKNQDKLQ